MPITKKDVARHVNNIINENHEFFDSYSKVLIRGKLDGVADSFKFKNLFAEQVPDKAQVLKFMFFLGGLLQFKAEHYKFRKEINKTETFRDLWDELIGHKKDKTYSVVLGVKPRDTQILEKEGISSAFWSPRGLCELYYMTRDALLVFDDSEHFEGPFSKGYYFVNNEEYRVNEEEMNERTKMIISDFLAEIRPMLHKEYKKIKYRDIESIVLNFAMKHYTYFTGYVNLSDYYS